MATYSELMTSIGKIDKKKIVGEDGKTYQLEIQAFWDTDKNSDVRVIVLADDGGWRAFKPVTDGMRRPVSGRDAVRSQVIDVLKAQMREEASHRRHRKKAGGAAASLVGERRGVPTIAQQQPNDSGGS